jgi:hypothetical protein
VDPVRKVIELGTVVGLANHTILKSRDGSLIPIDDSAAPIRGRPRRFDRCRVGVSGHHRTPPRRR